MWVEDEKVLEAEECKFIAEKKEPSKKRKKKPEAGSMAHAQKKLKVSSDSALDDDGALAHTRKARLSQQKAKALQAVLVL